MHRIFVDSYFSSAHFLSDEAIHGHNYGIRVMLKASLKSGMVHDFREVQKYLRDFCMSLDHFLMIPTENEDVRIERDNGALNINAWGRKYVLPSSDVVLLPLENITSELLATYAYKKLKEKVGSVASVRIYENMNCSAEYTEQVEQ